MGILPLASRSLPEGPGWLRLVLVHCQLPRRLQRLPWGKTQLRSKYFLKKTLKTTPKDFLQGYFPVTDEGLDAGPRAERSRVWLTASSWLVLLSVDPPGTQTGAQERGTQIPVPWEHIPTGPGAAAREGQVQKSRREAVAAINKCSVAFLC